MTDWMEFFASLASSLGWPAFAFTALFVLRRPLVDLAASIQEFSGFGFHTKLNRQLERAEENSAQQESGAQVDPERSLVTRTPGDPVGTIVRAWQEVEAAVIRLVDAQGLPLSRAYNVRREVTKLAAEGRISNATLSAFNDLASIRNATVHARHEPTEGQAAQFAELVDDVVRAIDYQADHARAHGRGDDEPDDA